MGLSDYELIFWFVAGTTSVVATFWVFGVELALYLFLGVIGLYTFTHSETSGLQIAGGWLGIVFVLLFLMGLIYYISSKSFFPQNVVDFRFLKVAIDFLNEVSKTIGGFVLSLFSRKL